MPVKHKVKRARKCQTFYLERELTDSILRRCQVHGYSQSKVMRAVVRLGWAELVRYNKEQFDDAIKE